MCRSCRSYRSCSSYRALSDSKDSDMEKVMSLPSAAGVKFQSVGKFLVLNICCFAVNVLCLDILLCFCLSLMGYIRVYKKAWGIKSQNVLYFGFHVVLKKKISINE